MAFFVTSVIMNILIELVPLIIEIYQELRLVFNFGGYLDFTSTTTGWKRF